MSDKKTISAKVEQSLLDQIDQYAEERDLRRSPAIRDLIRAGLDQHQHTISLPFLLMWIGSLMAVAQYASVSGVLGTAGLVAFVAGFALTRESIYRKVENLRGKDTES